MPNVKTTEYTFSSVRIRALESEIVGKERIDQLLDAPNIDSALTLLSGFGFSVTQNADGSLNRNSDAREKMLSDKLCEAYQNVEEVLPEKTVIQLAKFRYDCHNIKSALKCASKNIDCTSMLIPLGTVSAEDIKMMTEKHEYALLPANMAKAAQEAEESFSQTGNPQLVDLLLDGACFLDMLATAEQLAVPFLIDYVKMKIDLTNMAICLRVIRMGHSEVGSQLLEGAVLKGGSIEKSFFMDAYENGEEWLLEKFQFGPYYLMGRAFEETDHSLAAFERCSENYQINRLKEVKFIPVGPEVAFAYLEAVENSIRNIRIVLAGKDAGLETDVIRERVRACYV